MMYVPLRSWEDLNLDDVDIRFKWAGLFHRAKRTPKKFMMRIKVREVCVCVVHVRVCLCVYAWGCCSFPHEHPLCWNMR